MIWEIISYGIWVAFLIAIVYFAIKRFKDKKKETFEKRDN